MKIIRAWRSCFATPPRPTSTVARAGLAYEKKVAKVIQQSRLILHNPQFAYETICDSGYCIPDIVVLEEEPELALVIECKLTYKEEAIQKLRKLYCPVVSAALNIPTRPIVVCKHLIAAAPAPQFTLESLLCTRTEYLLQWLGRGPL